MMENKKLLIGIGAGILVLVTIVLVLIFGAKKPQEEEGSDPNLKAGKLTLWTPLDDENAYEPYREKLIEKHQLTLNVVKKDFDTYEEDLINAIASGKGPDIFLIKNDWVVKHYQKISAKPFVKTQYSDSVQKFKKSFPDIVGAELVGGKKSIYGIPISSDPLVLYINKTMFREKRKELNANPKGISANVDLLLQYSAPSNWNDFKTLSKLLTEKNGTAIVKSGAALGTANNIESAQDILYLMMLQNETKFRSEDGKTATFHLQQTAQNGSDWYPGTEALKFYTSFSDPNNELYSWNESMPNATEYFIKGKVAMMVNFASRANYIKQMNPNLDMQIKALPQVKQSLNPNGYMQYWAMTVNRNSKFKKKSWAVINLISDSVQRQKYLAATGRNPIFLSDLSSKNIKSVSGQIAKAKGVYKYDVKKYNDIMIKMINDVAHSKQPPQLSIEDAARDVTSLLGKR